MENKTYKGIDLTFTSKKYDSKRMRYSVSFTYGDSSYENAHLLPHGAVDGDVAAVQMELEKWAELVIDEQIGQADRVIEQAKEKERTEKPKNEKE